MARRGSKSDQRARTEAERARLYAARTEWHDRQQRRRVRDNVIVGIVGGLLLVGVVVSQALHAQTVAPEPTPTPTSTPAPSGTPSPTPDPSATPTETPAP